MDGWKLYFKKSIFSKSTEDVRDRNVHPGASVTGFWTIIMFNSFFQFSLHIYRLGAEPYLWKKKLFLQTFAPLFRVRA